MLYMLQSIFTIKHILQCTDIALVFTVTHTYTYAYWYKIYIYFNTCVLELMFLLHILSNALIILYFTCSGSVEHSRTASLMRIFGLKYLLAVWDKELQIADMNTDTYKHTHIQTHTHAHKNTHINTHIQNPPTHTRAERQMEIAQVRARSLRRHEDRERECEKRKTPGGLLSKWSRLQSLSSYLVQLSVISLLSLSTFADACAISGSNACHWPQRVLHLDLVQAEPVVRGWGVWCTHS